MSVDLLLAAGALCFCLLVFIIDLSRNRVSSKQYRQVESAERRIELVSPLSSDPVTQTAEPSDSAEMPVAAEALESAEVLEPVSEPVHEPAPAPAPEPATAEAPEQSFFQRVRSGLSRTRGNLTNGLADLIMGAKSIDEDLLEEIETLLLTADVGISATQEIIQTITSSMERGELKDPDKVYEVLEGALTDILADSEAQLDISQAKPFVILVVGINGVGKTTTIGKMAKRFQAEGKSVMLAAGDTFRAAAVEQLQVWGERNQVPVVAQHTGADSASVIYDAVQSASSKGIDVVIADTAGRLHNKDNLMTELEKVVRVTQKFLPEAPHEVMLVLDAGTGQNALNQAETFQSVVGVTGLALTKLDGTAKGGVIFALAKQLGLPIRFIGVGEQIDDLRPFEAKAFVNALFERES